MRQTVSSSVKEDRIRARVAASIPIRARTVAWVNQARIVQGRASYTQEVDVDQKTRYVGIDVARKSMVIPAHVGIPGRHFGRRTIDFGEACSNETDTRQAVRSLSPIGRGSDW